MSQEADIRVSLQIKKDTYTYQSQPTAFKADLSSLKGAASPGGFIATKDGVDIDLSNLDTPGLCWIQNLDTVNSIVVGRFDANTNRFYPFMKIKPGECYVVRLSEDVEEEYAGTGTGTTASNTTLRVKAYNASCNVVVHAFND